MPRSLPKPFPSIPRRFLLTLLLLHPAFAQNGLSPGLPPPSPARIQVPPGPVSPVPRSYTAVTPQYNFSYGADPNQPGLPASGLWNFYMPIQVDTLTPGWTTGEYGIGGLPDTFYGEPAYTTGGTPAGGCSWNQSYDAPPYWYFDGGAVTNNQYGILSGPILRSDAAIGSVYQSAAQQVPGSGETLSGFGAMAKWSPRVYTSAPYLIGAIYFASDSCYSGDVEYGFAHYNYYNPPVNQFYFYNYSNCAAPTGLTGSYGCFLTAEQTQPQAQCSAAVNLPTLAPNSKGTDWYFWYAFIDRNPAPPTGDGHWVFSAGLLDPYSGATAWSCVGDPLGSPTFPVAACPQLESTSYQCDTPFPTQQLHDTLGAVTVGITNGSNTPPAGRVNPMLQMNQLYITQH